MSTEIEVVANELTVGEKLAVRDMQIALISAKERVQNIETSLISFLNSLAAKFALDSNQYVFDLDNLTFKKK